MLGTGLHYMNTLEAHLQLDVSCLGTCTLYMHVHVYDMENILYKEEQYTEY
jgi:hypothetical protein